MNTRTLFTIASILFLFSSIAAAYERPRSQADWPFCRVQYRSPNGGSYAGTGTQIDSSGGRCLILTNYHVIQDAWKDTPIRCTFLTGRRVTSGRVVWFDKGNDIAAIVATCAGAHSMVLAPFTDPRDTYTYGGFGSGSFRQVRGTVRDRSGLPQGAKYRTVLLSASVRSGDSGGAVMNSKHCMCGILWGCDADGAGTRATMGAPFFSALTRLMQYCHNGQCYRPSDDMQRQVQYGTNGLDPLQFASTKAPLFNPPTATADAPSTFPLDAEDPVPLPGAPPSNGCCQGNDPVMTIQPMPTGGAGVPFIMQGTLWLMPQAQPQPPQQDAIRIEIQPRRTIENDRRAENSQWRTVYQTCSNNQQQIARLWFMQQQTQSANYNRQLQMMMMMRHLQQQQQTQVAWVYPRYPILWRWFGIW